MNVASLGRLPVVAATVIAVVSVATWRSTPSADWFADYRDLGEVNAHIDALAALYPDTVRIIALGESVEGRPIRAVEVSHGGDRVIVLDGGQHAREWVSVMVPLCIADRLATTRDPRIRKVLESVRFEIVPVVNPDGYDYTWKVDRNWRKNRRGGYGVDLNRNYSIGWGQADSSDDPRSQNYRGERPFSEPETRAMRHLFEIEHVAAHVDFHSFSQVIVYPWSYKRAEPRDGDRFAAVAERIAASMIAAHDKPYAIRPGAALRVGAGGTAGDWSYATHGALSFLIELRPSSRDDGGFVLPPEQIVPTCDEAFAGVIALAESLD